MQKYWNFKLIESEVRSRELALRIEKMGVTNNKDMFDAIIKKLEEEKTHEGKLEILTVYGMFIEQITIRNCAKAVLAQLGSVK